MILVLSQACSAIAFDAVAIGLLFQRISRGHKRGKTIVFSDTAVIQRVGGVLYLMFRVGEIRRHQLRDASVRAYCIRHERHCVQRPQPPPLQQPKTRLGTQRGSSPGSQQPQHSSPNHVQTAIETTHFVTRSMKLLHEEVSSQVLMSLPQVIVHRIDATSPLSQPAQWYDASGALHAQGVTTNTATTVEGKAIPVEQRNHVDRALESANTQEFLCDREAEIVVLVEGTDELTGAIIQSRHSYTPQDLAWDHSFVPCVFRTSVDEDPRSSQAWCCRGRNGRHRHRRRRHSGSSWWQRSDRAPNNQSSSLASACTVDFAAFHSTRPAPDNVEISPYVF